MHLRTERCTIRDFTPEDIQSFMAYRNDLVWMRYQGFKGLSRERYEKELLGGASLAEGRQFAVEDTRTGQLVGDIYLRQQHDAYWIGYAVHPRYARQGYASEAVSAVIAWVAGRGGAVIKAGVAPDNAASIRLLEKLAFTRRKQEGDELIYTLHLLKK